MGYRLFVHKGDHTIELKIGKNPSTDRLLKGTENLERLLLNGEFNFEYNFLTYEEVKTYLKSSLVDQSYSQLVKGGSWDEDCVDATKLIVLRPKT